MVPRPTFPLLAAAATLLMLAACGGSQYGDNSNFNFADASPNTLASSTPTPSAPGDAPAPAQPQATSAPAPQRTPTPRPVATAAPAPPTQQSQAPTFAIAVNSDTSTQPGFSPSQANVYTGTVVSWTNRDSVPRSVVATGAFDSGPIAPGATFKWVAGGAGSVDYHDGTRPYVVGKLTVIAR